jgi:hypothetical protein
MNFYLKKSVQLSILQHHHYMEQHMKRFLLALSLSTIVCFTFTIAQELDCDVKLDMPSLTTEARSNLDDFVAQIKQYMNSNRWTKEDLNGEKIKCTIEITVLSSSGDNHFTAKVFIGSQRPIYKLNGRSTATTRILDDKWEFSYIRNQSLTHDEYRFDPLLSFLDFYAYVIIGYDFDSGDFNFAKPGFGAPYFQKAFEIINKGRNTAGAGKGWDESTTSIYSRGQLIDELLNPKFQELREAAFRYHYRGLDLLYKDDVRARKNILTSLQKIANLQKKINRSALSVRTFFDTKYLEIADIFLKDPDLTIYTELAKYDPAHQQTYLEYSQRKR